VYLNDAGRRKVILAYQERKEMEVDHRVASSKTPIGLLPHVQARVLARHIRGDIPHYIPYIQR
jgi:CRISPR-associated protein Cas1